MTSAHSSAADGMGGSTVAADAVRIISPLLETHHAEHVLYEVRGSTQTSKYQPCMHSHAVSSFTPDARFRTSCAGLEIKAPEFRAQAKRKASIYKDVSSRRQEPVDKSAERKSSQAQIRGLSGRVECDKYPVVFSLPRHGTKDCNNKRFLPRKIEEKEFPLVLWCIITHSSASSHRQQRGRDHPLRPPGVGGNDTRNANEVMKRKRKRPVS